MFDKITSLYEKERDYIDKRINFMSRWRGKTHK